MIVIWAYYDFMPTPEWASTAIAGAVIAAALPMFDRLLEWPDEVRARRRRAKRKVS